MSTTDSAAIELALLIVKVEGGTDRMGPHIHEHQIGGKAIPVGEMRKVQSHRHPRCRLDPVGRGTPALAVAVDRPHLEDIDLCR